MRILLSLIAVVAFMASATAQDVSTEKKARKVSKTEAVSTTEVAPKAGCCANKAAGASCSSKAGKAEASTEAAPAEGTTAATDAAAPKAAGCCAGKSTAEKAACHGKAEAHNHDHGGDSRTEEAPAEQPNH